MADLNGDGTQDLVSGCFEGVVYWMAGIEGGFAAPAQLRDSEGDPLRLGQFWNYVTTEWDEVDKSEHRSQLGISAFPVDWDADGDLDLLLGSNEGNMYVRLNEGSATDGSFAPQSIEVQVNGKLAEVPGGHAQPVAADWDGDGLFDLVSGGGRGGVYWWRNTGSADAPAFAEHKALVEPIASGPGGPQRGIQVAVADFDMDGDLVLGDQVGREAPAGSDREMGGRLWVVKREGPLDAEPVEAGAPR